MIIEYEKSEYIREKKKLEIKDIKNVFLKGTDQIDKCTSYLGIWENEKYVVIVKLLSGRFTKFSYYLKSENSFTEVNIKSFLEDTNNVTFITRDEFKEKLKSEVSDLEI